MTPERKSYLKSCSKREWFLRSCIKAEKIEIKHRKWCLSVSGINYDRQRLKESQRYLQMYRHELNRLKGMNNVVVPRQVRMATYPARHGFGFGYECVAIGLCACGAPLRDDECKYCQRCGKRVLWEEVE